MLFLKLEPRSSLHENQAPVVQQVDKAIHWINLYAVDNVIASPNTIHHHWFPREMTSEKRLQKFYTDEVCSTVYVDLGSASDWLKQNSLAPRPIRSSTQIWVVLHHFAGKPVVVSRNLVCFLRLKFIWWIVLSNN